MKRASEVASVQRTSFDFFFLQADAAFQKWAEVREEAFVKRTGTVFEHRPLSSLDTSRSLLTLVGLL